MPNPELSVIIPTFKRHDSLARTLKSVEQARSSSIEVIVVDQSRDSRERSDDFCREYPFLKYICLLKPGLPNARNSGILNSTGSVILFIDDDTTIHPECFTEHLKYHKNKEVSVVAGRIKQMNNSVSWAQSETVAVIDDTTGETTGNFDCDYEGDVVYATGGHMSVKRKILKHTDLFNPRFTGNALFEDVEFSCRIRKKGYSIHYTPTAIVYHYPENTGGCHESKANRYLIERLHNHTLFYLLHINRIPSGAFIIYIKNLVEYISRKKNKRHSIKVIVLCAFSIGKALLNTGISLFFNPKLN